MKFIKFPEKHKTKYEYDSEQFSSRPYQTVLPNKDEVFSKSDALPHGLLSRVISFVSATTSLYTLLYSAGESRLYLPFEFPYIL